MILLHVGPHRRKCDSNPILGRTELLSARPRQRVQQTPYDQVGTDTDLSSDIPIRWSAVSVSDGFYGSQRPATRVPNELFECKSSEGRVIYKRLNSTAC